MSEVRHAILRILWGKTGGERFLLAPGDVLRIGRSEEAEVEIGNDALLSKIHFEIDWDGERCEVRDRGGLGGIELDGRKVVQAWAHHGAWIRAGMTNFSLHYEAHTPPRKMPLESEARKAAIGRAHEAICAELSRHGVYAVLDAAQDERILVLLREGVEEHASLYEGAKGNALSEVAPYVLRFERDCRLLRALLEEGLGLSWGIFAVSDGSLKAVRRHFRRFLMVEEETSLERYYFRYYDPRVLRDFFTIATMRQKSEMFGEVSGYLFEGSDLEMVRVAAPAELLAADKGQADVSHS